ncbi:ATP-binding protein [Candidatus Weimeria sp. HCP3S3_B5]|uniref:sensor histidine kinase n=1 Tax=Candidatus Weimeria sp. HCP3S3_B5 TaxID=3438871 RepID=UPI003F8BC56E
MQKKIQTRMIQVIALALTIAYAVTIFFVYRTIVSISEKNVIYESEYLSEAVNYNGSDFLKSLKHLQTGTRITLIDRDGSVLYDSKEDSHTLENHKNRPEVAAAFRKGRGMDKRKSDTLKEDMYYSAIRLDDGRVLRIAKSVKSILATVLELLPAMIITVVLLLIAAFYFAHKTASDLIRPINSLDLDNPLDNDVYEEIKPLLVRIDEQNKQKDAMVAMRQEFSANVSHELKTPLTSISGYAEIIRDGLVKKKDIPDFSDRIYREANRMINLVNDIIKISKLDEGEIGIDREQCDLYQMSSDIITRLVPKAREYGVHVSLIGNHLQVNGYRQVLDEMIQNIVENAIKYNKPDGKVTVTTEMAEGKPCITVKDTGIGIPKKDQERIFERFYRVDKSHSRETGGTGLGLSIVKHAAAIHNARIILSSVEGEGTTITIVF